MQSVHIVHIKVLTHKTMIINLQRKQKTPFNIKLNRVNTIWSVFQIVIFYKNTPHFRLSCSSIGVLIRSGHP